MIDGTIEIQTEHDTQVLTITDRIKPLVPKSYGMLFLFNLHTTSAIAMNENEQGLHRDLVDFFKMVVPKPKVPGSRYEDFVVSGGKGAFYHHDDLSSRTQNLREQERSNGWAHIRSLLLPQQLWIPYKAGELVLGQFQEVLYLEFDGPQKRSLYYRLVDGAVS